MRKPHALLLLAFSACLSCKAMQETLRGRHKVPATAEPSSGPPGSGEDAQASKDPIMLPKPTVPEEVFRVPEPDANIPLEGIINRRATGGVEVAGSIAGIWDKALQPIFVVGDITLKTGKTLIVREGVKVVFEGNYRFYVEGALLKIVGSAAAPVTFTTAQADQAWQGIRVCPGSDCNLQQIVGKLEIRHAIFERARKMDTDLNDSTWRRGGVFYIRNTETALIEDSLFQNNASLERAAALEIIADNPNTIFRRNTLRANSNENGGGALQITSGRYLLVDSNVFSNNSTKGDGGALAFIDSAAIVVKGNIFEGNRADAGGGAISCDGHGATIQIDSDNVFRGNTPNDVVCKDP